MGAVRRESDSNDGKEIEEDAPLSLSLTKLDFGDFSLSRFVLQFSRLLTTLSSLLTLRVAFSVFS
jgi:hypothetical protein